MFATADGHIIVAAGSDAQWQRFCSAIERSELPADQRYSIVAGRVTHRLVLIPDIEQTLRARPSDYWPAQLSAHGDAQWAL